MAEYSKDLTADSDQKTTPAASVSDDDQAILNELNDRFSYASIQWAPIIEEADTDVRYSSGNTWDPDDEKIRADRPKLKLDQLSQYTNQLVNSFRQNPRGAKVSPAGGGATEKTAELRANRIRQIEYDSHAQEVYTVAGENAVTRGYGYARIVAEYEDSTSDNQTLRLKAIPNPNQVLPDPDAESTSGADWDYLFFIYTVTKAEFKREYPDAKIQDFTPETMALAPKWFTKEGRIQIAEYWYVTHTPAPNGKGRPKRTVCMYLTNGVELLQKPGYPKKTEWRGSSIPFAACFGKIIYQAGATQGETQKMLQSYIRLARDAAKAYNWTKSTELEALALPVRAALMGYKGQADQHTLDEIERATREPVAWLEFKAQTEDTGQQVLPLPQYGTRNPDIQGYEIAAESYRRDVQNALGRYSAQDHRLGSTKVTSGVALRELDKSGDLGSFHFVAHYDDMIRELAVKLDELLPFYDGNKSQVTTRLPNGTTKTVTVNKQTGRAPKGESIYGPDDLRFDANDRHAVTISTGPSFDSQRAEAKEAVLALMQNPQLAPVVASQGVRMMDLGPEGDQLAKDLEFVQPPAMQQARAAEKGKDGQPPDPQMLMQQVGQMKQQLQELEGVAQQQHEELKGKQAEIASKERIAQWEISSKERMAAMDREVKIAVAELGAKTDRTALFLEERQRIGAHIQDAASQAADHLHEHTQAEIDRQHAVGMAAAGAATSADEAQAQRDHAAEMGDMSHQQTLEAQQQAAELAPQPEAGA